MSQDFDLQRMRGQQLTNYPRPVDTVEEVIRKRIAAIDIELEQFSEERKQRLWSERARLLKAQEALKVE